MSPKSSLGEIAKRALDASIHAARSVASEHGALRPYERVLAVVRARSGLLARRAIHGVYAANRVVLALALEHEAWLAPIETWQPGPAPERQSLAGLAEHLLDRYPLPALLASVWHEGEPGRSTREQRWYKQLGLGESLRRIGVPIPLTRAMAHRFLSAPCHLGMVPALRWAQLTELGASAPLRDEVLRTLPRAREAAHQGPGAVRRCYGSCANGTASSVASRPRTSPGRPRPSATSRGSRSDAPCGSSTARAMRHCVATYVRACVQGRASIWSLQAEIGGLKTRVLTLEVDPEARRLVPARRRHNGSPSSPERVIVRRWADREGIIIPPALRDLQ